MLEQQIVESRAAPLEDENIEQITQKLEETSISNEPEHTDFHDVEVFYSSP